jgi:hypothetical protein
MTERGGRVGSAILLVILGNCLIGKVLLEIVPAASPYEYLALMMLDNKTGMSYIGFRRFC